MLTLENLRTYGANVEEGMGRCFNNESFYLGLIPVGLADGNFDKLAKAMEENNVAAAFEAVHALKGSIGNLALTPLYTLLSELTEQFRGKTEMPDVADLYARVQAAVAEARKLLD